MEIADLALLCPPKKEWNIEVAYVKSRDDVGIDFANEVSPSSEHLSFRVE